MFHSGLCLPSSAYTAGLRLGVVQRVLRDIEADDLQAGAHLQQVFDEEAFGTPDVQDTVARLEAPVVAERFGDRDPTPVVTIAAVAL